MARKKPPRAAAENTQVARQFSPVLLGTAALALATLVFHWVPLTSSQASIQWDAVDVHYSLQKYFADHLHQGVLPHWTPYVFSGYPFLADPQVGAWYPLNWPFFLVGITPGSIQAELALHTLLAATGAFLLAFHWLRRLEPALVAGLAYGFSGFFAGHASHVGMSQTAAWLPWLLIGLVRSFETTGLGWPAATGLMAGSMALAGHFQSALYCGFGCAAYAVWYVIAHRPPWNRIAVCAAAILVITGLISAVMVMPGLPLLAHSVRARADFSGSTNSPMVISALGTLVVADALGAISGVYNGPADVTQYYLYGGLLLLPLAALGAARGKLRGAGAALVVPGAWYAFGPSAGLYTVLSKLPGLGAVRAPVHIWFVVTLGLALLAASGVAALPSKFGSRAVLLAVVGILFADLAYFNSFTNPLTYTRSSFEAQYGAKLAQFQQRLGSQLPTLTRFYAPFVTGSFGPQNHPLDARVETTYGYNPLVLRSYQNYLDTAATNPKLLDELGAQFRLDPAQAGVANHPESLPRAMFPAAVVEAGSRSLAQLNPAQEVLSPRRVSTQDASATAKVVEHREGFYRIEYQAHSPSLLRFAEAYYPGWEASAGGKALEVFPVDEALLGMVVPAGQGEITLQFHTEGFGLAAALTLIGMAAAGAMMVIGRASLRLS